jgi:NTP pyrophosphatase (non-canonical NTP hydrolase)
MKNYQELAKRTCASLGDEKLDLAHMVLGIISEQEELLQAIVKEDEVNQREEMADICWYLANYCTFRNYDFSKLVEEYQFGFETEDWEENVCTFDVYSSKLADYVKKYIAYGKSIDRELEERALGGIIYSFQFEDCEFDFNKDLERNIKKLEARFPEKFSQEKALNRDLNTERKILES